MTKTVLEYTKMILDKVSFDVKLLEKEYKKAISVLSPLEVRALNAWVGKRYTKILEPIYIPK